MWIIYKVSFPNGKVYIGQTKKDLEDRKHDHEKDTKYEPLKKASKFHLALAKHPDVKWEEIDTAETWEQALEKEAGYIKKFDSIENGYNCRTSQNGPGSLCEESKQKIASSVSKHGIKHWDEHPERRKMMSETMKRIHAEGKMDEAKCKSTKTRRSTEQRQKTSEDNKKRYQSQEAREKMAAACGSKPFLVYKKDTKELVGRFVSIKEAYRQLNIPDNGHITTILRNGCGSLYGYLFVYE